ncbi:MAG: response regulator [Chitinophagaceae bacterium]
MPKTVLVIEDETDLCLLLKAFFVRKKYEVATAATLEEGLKQIDLKIPDILFLDNNLPDGLGWEHASALTEKYPDLFLNLISAYHPSLPNVKVTSRLKIWEKPISLRDLDAYLDTLV